MLRERTRPTMLGIGIFLLSAALVAGGLAAPATAATSVATAVARILADTNAFRAANGKPPLVENTAIDAVSQGWANQLAQPGQKFDHNPDFFSQMPAGASSGGENIASGFSYDTVVNRGWANSAGHKANMLGDWTDIGIGYYESADGSTTYLVQNFGYYASHVGQGGAVPPPPVTSDPTSTPSPTATPTPTPTPSASSSAPPTGSSGGSSAPSTALVPLSSLPTPVASTATAPIPKVVGNRLVNTRTNATWTAHAVNWPSFEYACQQGWAYAQSGRTAAAAQTMVSWGITAVRLPLNEDCWLGTNGSPRYGTAAGYQTAIRQFVDILNAAGLVVILDLHWSGGSASDSDGQRAMTDDQSPLFWEQVSYAYSKVPSVMFDAFNEPYSRGSATLTWSCWANGGCSMPDVNDTTALNGKTFTVVGMKDIVSAIRGTGAAQPILLAGLDYANDLRGWLANRPADSQLVASWHNYPGQRCQTVSCWNGEVAPVAAQVPVIATEFGETDGGTSFLTTFMDWADGKGVGYAPWAWWWTDASDGAEANAYALIQNGTFTPKAPQGTTYADHLMALSHATLPVGWMDTASMTGSTLTASGWAIDPDTSSPITVRLTVDGQVAASTTASGNRPGLGSAVGMPSVGDQHGYSLSAALSIGKHLVCAVALNDDGRGTSSTLRYAGANASGNCATVDYTGSAQPFGWMDRLILSGSILTVSGWAIDPDTGRPITTRLTVDGAVVATGAADVSRTGLSAALGMPSLGDAHGFSLSTSLTIGAHTVCVVGVNDAPGPDTTLSYAAANTSSNCATTSYAGSARPFGWLDRATTLGASLSVAGWAMDPDTASPVTVQLQIDGRVVGSSTADVSRPGLATAVGSPSLGDAHGYSLSAPLSVGVHTVCVVAVNDAAGANTTLSYAGGNADGSCARVTYAGPARPLGWMDSASVSASKLTITGWAIDPDTAAPVTVRLEVDGDEVATTYAGRARPGLSAAVGMPANGDAHGYTLSTQLPLGTHVVCAVADDDAAGPAAMLRYAGPSASGDCAVVTNAGSPAPFGWMDAAALVGTRVAASGWAIDPDVADPIQVRLLIDGATVATTTAGIRRVGLAAAIGSAAGDDHGFTVTADFPAGTHTVCAVAQNDQPGANTTLSYAGAEVARNCAVLTR